MNLKFKLTASRSDQRRTQCLIVGILERRCLTPAAKALNTAGGISQALRHGDMDGRIGQSLLLHAVPGTAARRILLIGCGKEIPLRPDRYCELIRYSVQVLCKTGTSEAIHCLCELDVEGMSQQWKIRQAALCAAEVMYRFDKMKSKRAEIPPPPALKSLAFTALDQRPGNHNKEALRQGEAIGKGISLTRDLANLPANICTPDYLAMQARNMSKRCPALTTKILNENHMRRLGMGSLLSVAQGAKTPPKLIVMQYQGHRIGRASRGKQQAPVVLIGKGVTFDTGGISLKPAASMDEMKFDMCGAAAVLGTLQAVAEMALPVHVVGLIPATENMPGGQATRPGDIVTSMSGRTIEILNTDAEGRLILCDALSYAARYRPEVVIDIATLTGACVIALGRHASGMMSNHPELAKALLQAGEVSRDRIWQLPLWEEYQQQLHSPFADVANIGGREAGTITAACFLWHFAKQYRWAHLDIAGTAWRSGKQKGATGRPVSLLCQYLMQRCS